MSVTAKCTPGRLWRQNWLAVSSTHGSAPFIPRMLPWTEEKRPERERGSASVRLVRRADVLMPETFVRRGVDQKKQTNN